MSTKTIKDEALAHELIAIIALKTISNYINHIQRTEVDTAFKAQAKREIRRVA